MFRFSNTYTSLPPEFYAKASPDRLRAPKLIAFNHQLAGDLGLEPVPSETDLAQIFSGQKIPEGAALIALAYAGHQFGSFVPTLGDGRALLLGEVEDQSGRRFDIQFKGSGPTAFSRRGDGKSALGPVIREYLVSEAMYHLGIPGTRALAAVVTGEMVQRESYLPGGLFTRVAASHIRTGTFQYFAARNNTSALRILLEYAAKRHYPELAVDADLPLHFLEKVAEAQATMIGHWLSVGFIHGVMNTDNMSISGETIDYGPCAFMDQFAHERVFSSIDQKGRYAWGNQISIGFWNLCRLAECLLPLVHTDQDRALRETENLLDRCQQFYTAQKLSKMAPKLGIENPVQDDEALLQKWLNLLENENLDFTLSFRNLGNNPQAVSDSAEFLDFLAAWQRRLSQQSLSSDGITSLMNRHNPALVPRLHLIEKAIKEGTSGDFSSFHRLLKAFQNPFEAPGDFKECTLPPLPEEMITRTFCGT